MGTETGASPRADAGIAELLSHRARRASDGRLAIDAAGGIGAAALLALLRFPGWIILVSVALCFVAFGVWGIADRELAERVTRQPEVPHRSLRVLRIAAVFLGALAAASFALNILGTVLGTWIS